MKYRIMQKGNKFYPQTKSFLFWSTVVRWYEEGYLQIDCCSYREALDILRDIKASKERRPKTVTIHEVYL